MDRQLPSAMGMLSWILRMEKPKTDQRGSREIPHKRDGINVMNVGKALLRTQALFDTGESTLERNPINVMCAVKPSAIGQPFFPIRTSTTK